MSWGSYTTMKCKECGKIYEIENSTLIMNREGYDKCPLCKSEGEVLANRSLLNAMKQEQELFKGRKKRIKL